MSSREERLKHCKLYKGEKESPIRYGFLRIAWEAESRYVAADDSELREYVEEYEFQGLDKVLADMADTPPIALCATIYDWNYHCLSKSSWGDFDAEADFILGMQQYSQL